MNDKILGAVGLNTPQELNLQVPETDGTFISTDAIDSTRNTYRKVVADSGRIPHPTDEGVTVQTITVTRTLLSNQ